MIDINHPRRQGLEPPEDRRASSRMVPLAAAVAAFSITALVLSQVFGQSMPLLLGVVGLICAFTTYRASAMSSFLKIFAAIFATETIVFGAIDLCTKAGLWPPALEEYQIPESLPVTVAIFAVLVYLVSHIRVVRGMTDIADRYFETTDNSTARLWPGPRFTALERRVATVMVVFLVVLNQAQVGIEVRLTFFSRDWFNAIQNKDEVAFWSQLLTVFLPWAMISIASSVIEFVVQSFLIIRWRRWLTEYYVAGWLGHRTHYHMGLVGAGADNPDQRIAEDVNRFIDGGSVGYGIYSFSILLISKLSSLVSFAILLWTLSANFTLPGTEIAVPGFLFWVALIYAGVGTVVTHLIGRPLVGLLFARQRYEADFRFSLARMREYAEQIALLKGERAEHASLSARFGEIIRNYLAIIDRRKKLTAFTATYGQISPFIPYIVAAPFYFAGKIQLGVMTQTASAFGQVQSSLTFFVNYYVYLADFKAVLDRLSSFETAMARGRALGSSGVLAIEPRSSPDFIIPALSLALPDGRRIAEANKLVLRAGEATLLTGPSGSGKSTLFRAIAGIWPFGEGRIEVPQRATSMLLPQRPYLPVGTLKVAATYPAIESEHTDDAVAEALRAARLAHLVPMLHEEGAWAQALSLGEQQRMAVARALLAKPDWLFLDEATAALDEPMEAAIYRTLREQLPKTTIVSIGHRSTLIAMHERRIDMRPEEDEPGVFRPVDTRAALAAQ